MEHHLWADEKDNDPEARASFDCCLAGMASADPPTARMIPSLVQTPNDIAITEDVASLRIVHMDGRSTPPDAACLRRLALAAGTATAVEDHDSRAVMIFRGGLGRPVMVELTQHRALHPPLAGGVALRVHGIDPDPYTKPRRAEYVFFGLQDALHEYACHA
jgi:hypothetical protein